MVQSERIDLSYVNRSNKYLLTAQDKKDAFERQYNHVYAARLEILKPRIIEAGRKALGEKMEYKQLEDLEMFEKAFVIGTIEKRISKRPSVLKEIAEEELIVPEDYDGDEMMSIVSNKDFLEFEDEKQIVKLEVKSDAFNVEQIIWPAPCPQRPWPTAKTGGVVAFVSGLELTGDAVNDAVVTTAFELMSRWLNGEISDQVDQKSLSSRVERLVVLGECIAVGQKRFRYLQ
ncbi:hypothetical protein ANCDUO_11630 [Ancylostoma duodenale]|uniref:DNA polymerase delta subunit OB-fold domain-containing protein n=1 Tax=Ancylostoma duodenale TaxID=51022 RepID=A0A0C2CN80_9BILA|nr:hypothetical protein ANCDUO_11630 [Ancylostoma duodenale]